VHLVNYKKVYEVLRRRNAEGVSVANLGERNEIKKAEKILKYKDLNNRNTGHVECKNKTDTTNNRGSWNHFRIIQKIPEQHAGKARNQGTTRQPYWELHTHLGKY
jgi:hypothetical protein